MPPMNSLLESAYNVSESVIQAGIHIILRDLTNYYWNKESEELDIDFTSKISEIINYPQHDDNSYLTTPNDQEKEVKQPQLEEDIPSNYDNVLQPDDRNSPRNTNLPPLKNQEIQVNEHQLEEGITINYDDVLQFDNINLPQNIYLLRSNDQDMELNQPQSEEDISINYDTILKFDNRLDSADHTRYSFDQLKDNFDNKENVKDYVKKLNVIPEENLENFDQEDVLILPGNSFNMTNENINCLSKLEDNLNETLKLGLEEEESLTKNKENEELLRNIPENLPSQTFCEKAKSGHNSFIEFYSNEDDKNTDLLDENNKITSTLKDNSNGLPMLQEENLNENVKDNTSLTNAFDNFVEFKLQLNVPNELDNFSEQKPCPVIQDCDGDQTQVTQCSEFYLGDNHHSNQNSNLSDTNNKPITTLDNTLEAEEEHFSECIEDDTSLLNEIPQYEANLSEPIKTSELSNVSDSSPPSEYLERLQQIRAEKESTFNDFQNDESLQHLIDVCRTIKSLKEEVACQNQFSQIHFVEPTMESNNNLDDQSTHTYRGNTIGVDCLWEDRYIRKYQRATFPEGAVSEYLKGNVMDDDKVWGKRSYTVVKGDSIPDAEYKCDCWMNHACLQVVSSDDEDDLLTDEEIVTDHQLESVETGSVSDWLYSVNQDNYWQPTYCIMNNTIQETFSEHGDDEQLEEGDIDIHERYIKTMYVKKWLDNKQNYFKDYSGCGDFNEF